MELSVCFGKSCVRRGAREVADTLKGEFARQGLPADVHRRGCLDLCRQSCNVLVEVEGERRIYTNVHPKTAHKTAEQIRESLEATAQPV